MPRKRTKPAGHTSYKRDTLALCPGCIARWSVVRGMWEIITPAARVIGAAAGTDMGRGAWECAHARLTREAAGKERLT